MAGVIVHIYPRAYPDTHATVYICKDSYDGACQAEASNRQELQGRLVEVQREAERDKKAACEQLKGELREAKREIAKLRNQVH